MIPGQHGQERLQGWQFSWLTFGLPLLAYLAIHLVLRQYVSQGVGYDEAEQVVWSQTLAWGYGPQPPLYSWLLWAFVQIGGLNLLTLALLKTAILGSIYLFLFLSARRVLRDTGRASLAAFSLLLVPLLAWGSLKGSTHSDLLCAVCLASFLVFLQLLETGRLRCYLTLGLLGGLGLLSKYNYALFAGALLAAAWTIPAYRARLCARKLLLTFGLALLVVLPHAVWACCHQELIGSYLTMKMQEGAGKTYVGGVASGLGSLVYRLWGLLTGLLVVWLCCFPQGFRPSHLFAAGRSDSERLLLRFFAVVGLCLLVLIGAGTNHFLPRWLTPFLLLLPILFFARLAPLPLSARRYGSYAGALAGAALVVILFRASQVWMGSAVGGYYEQRDQLFAEQVQEIRRTGFDGGTIIARDSLTGANLRLHFPQARLVCTNYPACQIPSAPAGPCLIVWNTSLSDMDPQLGGFVVPAVPEPLAMPTAVRLAEELQRTGRSSLPLRMVPLP